MVTMTATSGDTDGKVHEEDDCASVGAQQGGGERRRNVWGRRNGRVEQHEEEDGETGVPSGEH
eukprot:583483-Pyramimonas_sp.AAC.1